MNRQQSLVATRGLTDEHDRLIYADELLAQLQEACGGRLPGALAIPELRDLVNQSRISGLRIAREFRAYDGRDIVSGLVRINPVDEHYASDEAVIGGCEVLIENWLSAPGDEKNPHGASDWHDAADRAAAEITGHLDARQNLIFLISHSPDAREVATAFEEDPGKVWSAYFDLEEVSHKQPLHWRLLDGAKAQVSGSERTWRVRLFPIGPGSTAPAGFELALIANEPLGDTPPLENGLSEEVEHSRLVGSALTPVLRQPIARIVANAETIHAQLAGPLRQEYSEYAANIASAGQHLSGMLDDLADLEVVEAPDFKALKERVDLTDVAKRSAGILGVRAQSRKITVKVDAPDAPIFALAEFRRVLQILINLIGNAIAYSPEESAVTVSVIDCGEGTVSVTVKDQGPGVTSEQASKIFDKFERLGRDSDGGNDTGSGLGLFISRKLALAMGGDLEVLQRSGDQGSVTPEFTGAQFRLTLPVWKPKG